jgi:hypothetical protein
MYFRQATKRWIGAALAAAISLSLSNAPAAGQAAPSESAVKVAFIFNFLKFTQWPAATFSSDRDPIVLCVLGGSDLDGPLDTLRNRTVQNRSIQVRQISADGGGTCHVSYFGANVSSAIAQRKPPTVTIGDAPNFAAKGGMINFFRASGRLRFEINPQAAREGQIYFSADLLSLAKIVQTERG